MNVKQLTEHLLNIGAQGHGDAVVMIKEPLCLSPLYRADKAIAPGVGKILILYANNEVKHALTP